MEYTNDYQEDLQKVQDTDFTHNWVSSSAFLFYLQVACAIALIIGISIALANYGYEGKPNVEVPENTLYTPKYK